MTDPTSPQAAEILAGGDEPAPNPEANHSNTTGAKTKGDLFASFNKDDFSVPQGRDEDWRFTPLRRIGGLHNDEIASTVEPSIEVIVPDSAKDFISWETAEANDERISSVGAPVDRVSASVFSHISQSHILTVKKEAELSEPVEIRVTAGGADTSAFATIGVVVEQHARAQVILRTVGDGAYADFVTYNVADAARLDLAVLDEMEISGVHLTNHRASLGRDATFRHGYSAFGGGVNRITATVSYRDTGGDAEFNGVYFADDGQYFEQRLLVDHSVANCRSNVMYKGALQGDPKSDQPETRTAWVGDVLIRAAADNTDTYEMCKNLVLSAGARADAVPNLEIATGEIVGAGHAATVGRFDDEQLFYLMSRGISEPDARKLIVRGFFTEVINRITVPAVREELENRISTELDTVDLETLG